MAGQEPLRRSIARDARLLLDHSRRHPALTCRAGASSNEPRSELARRPDGLPISLHIPTSLPVAQGHVAQGTQQVAEHAVRVVRDAAWHAEQAARLAAAAGHGTRSSTVIATSFGILSILFGIAVVTAGHINMRADTEAASVATALRRLDATQRQIDERLTTRRTMSATRSLAAATGRGPVTPKAAAAAPPATAPVVPTGAAVPIATKPLPPVTWSEPNRSTRRSAPHDPPALRTKLIRRGPSSVDMAGTASGIRG